MKNLYFGDVVAIIIVMALGTILVSPRTPIETMPADPSFLPEKTFVVPFDTVAMAPPRAYPIGRDYVYRVKALDQYELANKMRAEGFTGLDGLNRNVLRQLYACFKYHQLFVDVGEKTGLPVSVVWSFFGFEALAQGVETDLFRIDANPGGIKWNGGDLVKRWDDCGGVPCDFKKLDTYAEMVESWADVFNLSRYQDCTGTDAEIIKCIEESGYSTASIWRSRAKLADKYFFFKKRFPGA